MNYETVNQENPEQQPTVISNEADVLSGKVGCYIVVSTAGSFGNQLLYPMRGNVLIGKVDHYIGLSRAGSVEWQGM